MTSPPHSVDGFVREFLRELNSGQGVSLSRVHRQRPVPGAGPHGAPLPDGPLAGDAARTTRTSRPRRSATCPPSTCSAGSSDNALLATDLNDVAEKALASCGLDLATLRAQEVEPGLGNGGLGRLAACFIDSLATMSVPCIGYGIRYEYGIFRQTFVDGRQVEQPDTWLALRRPVGVPAPGGGRRRSTSAGTPRRTTTTATERTRWVPGWNVLGVPYNYMVPGYQNGRVNTLRLWSAQATKAFDLAIFNSGDYAEAVRAQTFAENITKVLYPEDSTPQGKELRLQQQYFFVACSLARLHRPHAATTTSTCTKLPERIIFQLNDTHPVIAVPELMRILVDEKKLRVGRGLGDHPASASPTPATPCCPRRWRSGRSSCSAGCCRATWRSSTGSTTSSSPRSASAYPDDELRVRRMSIIADYPERAVRMAFLATVAGDQGQRRRRAALPAAARQGAARLLRALAGEVHQRHQRRHPAPLPAAGQPEAVRADHRHHRRRLGHRPGAAARAGAATPRTRTFRARVPRGQGSRTRPGCTTCCARATASTCPTATCST